MKPINVLSLFDGMSCGQIALERAGIPVKNYFASEIDKYAIKVTTTNYPNTIQLGDVTKWKEWNLPKIDLLIGGSPCQGFSNAGKGLNFDDPRSKLFFLYVDVLNYLKNENKNIKFLLENVRMKKEWQDIISNSLGINPIMIDSALVSAQSRKRLYWANWNFEEPVDKGIILQDILETDNDSGKEYFGAAIRNQVKKEGIVTEINVRRDAKSNCVVASYSEKLNGCIQTAVAGDVNGFDIVKRIYSVDGKSPTLTTMMGGHRQPKIDIRKKSNSIRIGERNSPANSRQVWDNIYKSKLEYRPLTPLECERLQTVPDNYTNSVSNSQRYKMLGNGWTVDVIAHIFRRINE